MVAFLFELMGKRTGKPPAFQLYASDLLTDVMDWTDEQVGAHIRLLCWSWVHRRGIPRDTQRLTRIAPASVSNWQVIGPKWVAGPDDTWINERLELTRTDSDNFRAKQKEKSDLAAEARRGKAMSNEHQRPLSDASEYTPTGASTGVPTGHPLEGEEEESIKRRKERAKVHEAEVWPSFTDFWQAYGKSRGKPVAMQLWAKVPQADREAIMAVLPHYTAHTPKQFRLDPERYLKRRAWEDEVIQRNTSTNGKPTDQQLSNDLDRVIAQRYGIA